MADETSPARFATLRAHDLEPSRLAFDDTTADD
jgi:hypothetical protein